MFRNFKSKATNFYNKLFLKEQTNFLLDSLTLRVKDKEIQEHYNMMRAEIKNDRLRCLGEHCVGILGFEEGVLRHHVLLFEVISGVKQSLRHRGKLILAHSCVIVLRTAVPHASLHF